MTRCVAVVEDEIVVLRMLCDVLEEGGFFVVALDHPDSIRSLGDGRRPDLFLIDLMLPGENGIDLARRLRARGFTSTPMIAMSASRFMTRCAAESGLFQETLYKPFDLDTLIDAVERHVPRAGAAVI
jgi:CheY-like chemotaxis protein